MNPDPNVCPVHGTPWVWQPAGISGPRAKNPGTPYEAFQKCQVKGCNQRPPRGGNGYTAPQAAPPQAAPQPQGVPLAVRIAPEATTAMEARLRAACAAWQAVALVEPATERHARAVEGYKFILGCYRGQATEPLQMREPGEDEDLDALFGEPTRVG